MTLSVQLKVYGTVGERRDITLAQSLPQGTTVLELKRLVLRHPELALGDDVNVRLIYQGALLCADEFVGAKVPNDGFVHCFVSAKPTMAPKREAAPKRRRLQYTPRKPGEPNTADSFVQLATYMIAMLVLLMFWFCYYETPQHFDVLAVTSLVGFTGLWLVMASGQLAQLVLRVCEDAPPPRVRA
jgi:hypothetical protein